MRAASWVVFGVAALVSVAWLVEACTVGRGFISTYLAPVAFLGIPLSLYLRRRASTAARE